MNYIDKIAARIGNYAPCPIELLRVYALLVLTRGHLTSREEVHNAWAVWCCGKDLDHKSLIPFSELTEDVRALDDPYVLAIRKVAAELNP